MSNADERHPVVAGLTALVVVGLVIGLFAGLAVWVGARAMHIGGATAVDNGNAGPSLYLPSPTLAASKAPNPLVSQKVTSYPSASAQKPAAGANSIQLIAVENSVAPMQRIDFNGSYPGGDGAILQFQRFENGGWVDFSATCSVNGGTFSTWIMTGRSGPNKFRVVDNDTKAASNPVEITVS